MYCPTKKRRNMAISKVEISGSFTPAQIEELDKFSQAAGVEIDKSNVVVVDKPLQDVSEKFPVLAGTKRPENERSDYYIYMRQCDKDGNNIDTEAMDLEWHFKGLKYMSLKGLDSIGTPKIYVEEYADSDTLRTYIPEEVKNSPIECELTLAFVGANRYDVYYKFNEYVRQGYHRYFDSVRKKALIFFVNDKIEPTEEMWKGSTPYLQVTYKLKSVKGHAVDKW